MALLALTLGGIFFLLPMEVWDTGIGIAQNVYICIYMGSGYLSYWRQATLPDDHGALGCVVVKQSPGLERNQGAEVQSIERTTRANTCHPIRL
jgi:hypothetical protein